MSSGDARVACDVVVLTHDDGPLLRKSVESALGSEEVDARVVVVDNASEAPLDLPEDRRIEVVRNEVNLGVGGGRNQGAALGSAPVVVFLDSDAWLEAGALARLLEPLAEDPTVAVAVPVFEGQPPEASAGRAPTVGVKLGRALGLRDTYRAVPRGAGDRVWDVDFGIGACQVVRREVFEAVGGIDDSDLFGPEDLDFCRRVTRAGFRVVQVAGTGVHHPPRRAHRQLLSRRGVRHARAVARYYARELLRRRPGRSGPRP